MLNMGNGKENEEEDIEIQKKINQIDDHIFDFESSEDDSDYSLENISVDKGLVPKKSKTIDYEKI